MAAANNVLSLWFLSDYGMCMSCANTQQNRLAVDARQWVESIQEYRYITELDVSVLNRLIKEIVVHEAIDSDKTRHISIEIHFNLKPIPEVEQVTG